MIKKYEEPGLNSHPHLEEKNYCQNQDQRFSSKRRMSQHRFKSLLRRWNEEDSQINPKKKRGRPLGSKNNKNNPAASNVIQKRNVPTKKGETL